MGVDNTINKRERKRSLEIGYKMTNPPPGEEICITGMAGRFPDSDDVYHFRDNLFNKVDLVSGDNRRWEPTHPEIPQRTGKINLVEKFDAGFFGVHQRQANNMDPMCRIMIERAFEAILDAGINPKELQGTNTGVYIGACFSESEKSSFYEKLDITQAYGISGCTRSMLAKRMSYWFQFQGPSFVCDTACSSSLFAAEHAYKALREGKCDTAIVGGCSLCLHPVVSLQFARLGVLSVDGACKSFDNAANGYARSEAVSVIVMQKAKDARRIYARVIHNKTNCDGYKEQGITYPSGKVQKVLLDEFYQECGVPPSSLTFVEAHGTGTKVGDPEELGTLDEVFCTGRDRPLLIGSVKSNIGHNEPVSGICSIVKVLIGMEAGFIPPNMHYKTPREGVEALEKGRMKVVAEKTPFPDDKGLIGINSFGFGGANSHLLLRWNPISKENNGLPKDNLPRLVCVSGRTEFAVNCLCENITLDCEHITIIHQIFKYDIPGHCYRGFIILDKTQKRIQSQKHFDGNCKDIYYVFGGLDVDFPSYGAKLFKLPLFAAQVQKIHDILSRNNINIDIMDVIMNYQKDNIVHQIMGTIVIQTSLADILTLLHGQVNGIIGYSIGELAAAYAGGVLTLEQVILAAYYTTKCFGKRKAGDVLLKHLKKIIPNPKVCLNNWIPNTKPYGKSISADYFCENLLDESIYGKSKPAIPQDSVTLEIGNIDLEKEAQTNSWTTMKLLDKKEGDINDLLFGIGSLYELGYNYDLAKLYPKVNYPVSRGTPMISPFIKWDHSKNWFITNYKATDKTKSGQRVIQIELQDDEWQFIKGHVIDGRQLFPATAYLTMVWETLAMLVGKLTSDMKVVFENVKFLRACTVPMKGSLEIVVMIQKGTGNFEITEGGGEVVTGLIYEVENIEEHWTELPLPAPSIRNEQKLYVKDIYKELRLRGYNYSDQFRALTECDLSVTTGKIQWTGNWIPFIDNMLQLQILKEDTRYLYVPTRIEKLLVDGQGHIRCTQELGEEPQVPVYVYKDLNIVRSGRIEIRGMWASSIVRRKVPEAVLETYKFVPNVGEFEMSESLRIFSQIALENTPVIKVKIVEIIDEETFSEDHLSPYLLKSLDDQPLIQPYITISSKSPIEVERISVEETKLNAELDCFMIAGTKLLERKDLRKTVFAAIKPNGYVISRESLHYYPERVTYEDLEILAIHQTKIEKLVLFQHKKEPTECTTIEINQNFSNWLPKLQEAYTQKKPIILHTNEELSGILGLVNCLRREASGDRIKCFFISKENPEFDLKNLFYKEQVQKGMAINVLRGDKWGTYRHLPLKNAGKVSTEHCYVNVTTRGDLSSLRWIEGHLTSKTIAQSEQILVRVYCASINFRDIMTASGRIQSDVVTRNRLEQECVQGFEFSGHDTNGRRVMGMLSCNAMATLVIADVNLLWEIPKQWSLEEAATIPAVYGTVLYAFLIRGQLKYGQSVLIHSATGGVGQAALNVAIHFGCSIFVTVGTPEKKDFIRRNFPQIRPERICSSRDNGFEEVIQRYTNGRGVDFVLNSLADEKLQASLRCLAPNGKFLEIGKFDLAANSLLGTDLVSKGGTFHGIMLDGMFSADAVVKRKVYELMAEGIAGGYVKPLPRTCFNMDAVEDAFRFMATGKHIGKVLIRIRKEKDGVEAVPRKFDAVARLSCDSNRTYIILGGLGGFGLELADWLVTRGCRKLVLTSRSGIKTGYQTLRINIWKSYGTTVKVIPTDCSTQNSTDLLLEEASKLGDIAGIFNLAVILKDAIFENQTNESFGTSCDAKAGTTQFLDISSRKFCPNLELFVVFSSVSCGRGNAGQTNYGYANSIMERLCEKRHAEGLPGVAIQWGAIGDVGLVAELQEEHLELVIGGTLQQKIFSCLEVMDRLLRQNEPIVGSMVVAEKRSGSDGANTIVDAVVNIMGLRDLKTVSLHSTLPELGMDSMMAVEIKQTLEREFEVFLAPQDIRSMTFARLKEISEQKNNPDDKKEKTEELPKGVQFILRFIPKEEEANIPVINLPTILPPNQNGQKVFLLPGIEGTSKTFETLAQNLNHHAICLQYCYDNPRDSMYDIAVSIYPHVVERLKKGESFNLVAHSFGSGIAIELTYLLEKDGYSGNVILLDGSPKLLKQMIEKQLEITNEAIFQTSLLCAMLSFYVPFEIVDTYKISLLKCTNYEERMNFVLGVAPKDIPHSQEYLKQAFLITYNRLKAVYNYEATFDKLHSNILLYKPTNPTVQDIEEDYSLKQYFHKPIIIKSIEGNHVTILDNLNLAMEINQIVLQDFPIVTGKSHDEFSVKEVTKHTIL